MDADHGSGTQGPGRSSGWVFVVILAGVALALAILFSESLRRLLGDVGIFLALAAIGIGGAWYVMRTLDAVGAGVAGLLRRLRRRDD